MDFGAATQSEPRDGVNQGTAETTDAQADGQAGRDEQNGEPAGTRVRGADTGGDGIQGHGENQLAVGVVYGHR